MLNLSGDVETLSAAFDTLLEKQRQLANQEIADTLPTVLEGVQSNQKQNDERIKELEDQKKRLDFYNNLDYSKINQDSAETLNKYLACLLYTSRCV